MVQLECREDGSATAPTTEVRMVRVVGGGNEDGRRRRDPLDHRGGPFRRVDAVVEAVLQP